MSGMSRKCFCRVVVGGIFCVMAVMMTACGKKPENKNATSSAVTAKRSTMETITIYSINSDTMSLIPVSVKKVSNNNSIDYICSLVQENLDEKDIHITECKQSGKKVIVSFSSQGKPVKNCSSKMEDLILESFANSLLDNVDGCESIIFRCDGDAYVSSQHSFEKNEVYASD